MVAEFIELIGKQVDVFTEDRELAQKIFDGFPGRIRDEQYHVDTSESDRANLYCFYNLNRDETIRFLKRYADPGSYELRDPTAGEFLRNPE